MRCRRKAPKAVADGVAGILLANVEVSGTPDQVFRALMTNEVKKWWTIRGVYQLKDWKADLHVQGRWSVTVELNGGKQLNEWGEFCELEVPNKRGINEMNQAKQNDPVSSNTASYTKTQDIQASPHQLYEAVSTVPGIKGWWSHDVVTKNGDITVRFGEKNFQTLRLLTPSPDKKVVWEWIAQYFPVEGTTQTDEWVGTRVSFDIQANLDGSSTLVFTHSGLTPQLVCYGKCNAGWNHFLESLKDYLEKGKGTPNS